MNNIDSIFGSKKTNEFSLKKGELFFNELKVEKEHLGQFIKKYLTNEINKEALVQYVRENLYELVNYIGTTELLKLNDSNILYDYGIYLYGQNKFAFIDLEMIADRLYINNQPKLLSEFAINVASVDHDEIESYLMDMGDYDALLEFAAFTPFANIERITNFLVNQSKTIKYLTKLAALDAANTMELENVLIEKYKETNEIDYLFKYCYNVKKIYNKQQIRELFLQSKDIQYISLYALLIDPSIINHLGDLSDLVFLIINSKEKFSNLDSYSTVLNEVKQVKNHNYFDFDEYLIDEEFTKIKK